MRIVLIDDHQLFREGLQAILEIHGVRVVAGAGTREEAMEAVRIHQPDIVLLDIHLGAACCGVDLVQPIRTLCPSARIILLTADESDSSLKQGLQNGVDGYLLKTLPARKLVDALSDVLAGTLVLPNGLKRHAAPPPSAPPVALTPRETEILLWLAQGKGNRDIGAMAGISENTVKTHIRNLMAKFEVNNRVLLAKVAQENGYRPIGSSAKKERDVS